MTRNRTLGIISLVVFLLVLISLTGILMNAESSLVSEAGLSSEDETDGFDRLGENLTVTPIDDGPAGTDDGSGGNADIDDGTLSLSLSGINPSSETEIPRLFHITYDGDSEVEVWVEAVNQDEYPGEVWFYVNQPEEVRFDEDTVVLNEGETVTVGIYVSSFDAVASDTLLESMEIHADEVTVEAGAYDD